MTIVPLRIRFIDEQVASDVFETFPPDDLDYVEGWSRKRDGDSQVVLLRLSDERYLQAFIALCRQTSYVVDVTPITETEFWNAPSHAI